MIYLAGEPLTVGGALTRLRCYPKATPAAYDLPACQPGVVSAAEIRRTHAVHSRIGERHAKWFVQRSRSWDWSAIPVGASLRDADPAVVDGLYDTASAMFRHFLDAKPSRVTVGKISKVLHLKYPALIPIVDTHLCRVYRVAARRPADQSSRRRGKETTRYWRAIRQDLLCSDLGPLREGMRHENSLAVLATLTDLRLLDVLAWSA